MRSFQVDASVQALQQQTRTSYVPSLWRASEPTEGKRNSFWDGIMSSLPPPEMRGGYVTARYAKRVISKGLKEIAGKNIPSDFGGKIYLHSYGMYGDAIARYALDQGDRAFFNVHVVELPEGFKLEVGNLRDVRPREVLYPTDYKLDGIILKNVKDINGMASVRQYYVFRGVSDAYCLKITLDDGNVIASELKELMISLASEIKVILVWEKRV